MSFPFPPGRLPRPAAPPAHITQVPGAAAARPGGAAREAAPRSRPSPHCTPERTPAPQLRPGRLRPPRTPLQAGQRRGPRRRILPAGCGASTAPAAPSALTHLGVSGGGGCRARARPMWLPPAAGSGRRSAARERRSACGTPPPLRQRDPLGVSRASGPPAPPPPAPLPPRRDYRRARDGPRDHLSAICPRSFLPSPCAPRPPPPRPITARLAPPPGPPLRLRPAARGPPGVVVRGAARPRRARPQLPEPAGGSPSRIGTGVPRPASVASSPQPPQPGPAGRL